MNPWEEAVLGAVSFGGIYRVENIQFFRCGQSGLLGGYPTHFHRTTKRHVDVFQSYVRNNVMHKSFQRACTIHETEFATVTDNAAFDVLGHVYFFEDGTENWNVCDRDGQ